MLENEIIRMHHLGFVTGAIAIRLSVESNYVRSVVRTHLKTVASSAKPQYSAQSEQRRKAETKITKARQARQAAAAELDRLDS